MLEASYIGGHGNQPPYGGNFPGCMPGCWGPNSTLHFRESRSDISCDSSQKFQMTVKNTKVWYSLLWCGNCIVFSFGVGGVFQDRVGEFEGRVSLSNNPSCPGTHNIVLSAYVGQCANRFRVIVFPHHDYQHNLSHKKEVFPTSMNTAHEGVYVVTLLPTPPTS